MSETKTQKNKELKCVSSKDLVELIMEPLSNQLEQARLEMIQKIQAVEDSIEILARHLRRESDKQS